MKRFIYKLSFFVAVLALLSSLLSGVSIITSALRSAIVFLATLLLIIIALNVLRWGILLTAPDKTEEENQVETKQKSE